MRTFSKQEYIDVYMELCQESAYCKKQLEMFMYLIEEHFRLIEKINKIQNKFGVIPIEDILYAILKDDATGENQWFPVFKKFRILTGAECDKFANYENPQPYRLKDLNPGMWVWDDVNKDCRQIAKINEYGGIYWYGSLSEYEVDKFEENRFFPLTKQENRQIGVGKDEINK